MHKVLSKVLGHGNDCFIYRTARSRLLVIERKFLVGYIWCRKNVKYDFELLDASRRSRKKRNSYADLPKGRRVESSPSQIGTTEQSEVPIVSSVTKTSLLPSSSVGAVGTETTIEEDHQHKIVLEDASQTKKLAAIGDSYDNDLQTGYEGGLQTELIPEEEPHKYTAEEEDALLHRTANTV